MQIALIDSGIGGLTLLKQLLEVCPQNDYMYFADSYAHPYGKQNAQALKIRLKNVSELLYERGAEMIVFACNTASTVALEYVSKALCIPVIGVKPICTSTRNTLIMCTPLTAQSDLIKEYEKRGAKIYSNPCLAPLIERYYANLDVLDEYLRYELKEASKNEKIILGCTHYVFLKEKIEGITGVKCNNCYDEVIEEVRALSSCDGKGRLRFIFTGPRKEKEYLEILAKI